ncbi:class II fumarate hydratase [Tepidiforma flava]|uniref:Fumarate hydratase class II n=1 Tax=Tepidiforma flava TaxID=3004094 RepID=A0ABY7M5Y5_9CHLR|nr:class II fumarate hydratase [Tepidiforma flava]WBL35947.1 class II fumarate hydratase [Tepidiforma flava]
MADATRIERDALGEFPVPADALYGIDTARAIANFPISGRPFPLAIVHALALLKAGAARANRQLGLLDPQLADAIITAATEVAEGRWDDQFPVDIYQTGSGTSTNMNVNEVIANRANELLGGGPRGVYRPVHPNDHVNRGQSSNDVVPTAIHLAAIRRIREHLLPGLYRLESALQAKSAEFDGVIKTGRTHLMDAVPVRLGQEFRGYAGQVERARRRVTAAGEALREVALGGTAVGTGLNTHPEFAGRALAYVSEVARVQLTETTNHFQAQSSIDAIVEASGHLRAAAVALVKIANDLRLMASGPRAGLAEIELPALQPGSSIMPGKVNPVIPEAVIQVAARVVGNDATIGMAGQWGFFELNTMLPVAGAALLESIDLLGNAAAVFAEKCIAGIRATERGPQLVEQGLAIATPLALDIGYDRTAELVKLALAEGITIREAARRELGLDDRALDRLFDFRRMTGA